MKAKATNQVRNLNNKTPLESMMMKIEYLWLPQRDDQDESLSAIKSTRSHGLHHDFVLFVENYICLENQFFKY